MNSTTCTVDNLSKHLKLNVFSYYTIGIICADIKHNMKPQIARASRGVVCDY